MVYPADVVLFEGILVFYSQEIRDMFHLRLFVDTDSDVRLSRRGEAAASLSAPGRGGCGCGVSGSPPAPVAAVLRDVQRGRDLEQILTQYTTFVKPAFEEFCLPVPPRVLAGLLVPPFPEGPRRPVLGERGWGGAWPADEGRVELTVPTRHFSGVNGPLFSPHPLPASSPLQAFAPTPARPASLQGTACQLTGHFLTPPLRRGGFTGAGLLSPHCQPGVWHIAGASLTSSSHVLLWAALGRRGRWKVQLACGEEAIRLFLRLAFLTRWDS